MRCFACNAPREVAPGDRVGFRDACDSCGADLHVCRSCDLHEPGAYNECRESNAEWVSDCERANRCEYFVPSDRGGGAAAEAEAAAKHGLEALFKK